MLESIDLRAVILVTVVAIGVVASYFDIRYRELPDWLSYLGGLLAVVYAVAFVGWAGVPAVLGGAAIGVGVFWLLWSLGMLGSGDVFIMGAYGALLAWPLVLWALIYVAFAGAVLGVIYSIARGTFGRTLRNIWQVFLSVVIPRRKRVRLKDLPTEEIPYAVGISLGAVWAALLPLYPALRLI